MRALLATAALLCALGPAALRAQTVVTTLSGLQFGTLLPGVVTRVPPTDAARRAQLSIVGRGNKVDIRLVLPTAMTSAAGDVLPLSFANGDAAMSTTKNPTPVPFDPATTQSVNLNSGGTTTSIYLGGTASPLAGQMPGIYTATVSVVITGAN